MRTHLERPAFWTETGDPESWFRALEAIASATQKTSQTGTPRTVAERCLVSVIAWRGPPFDIDALVRRRRGGRRMHRGDHAVSDFDVGETARLDQPVEQDPIEAGEALG